jgi:ankyrin repeat protein
MTLLHCAVMKGQENIVKFLIDSGANVNVRDKVGLTPLYHAAMNGQRNIAKLLAHNGANVNEVDNQGYTALHHAAINDQKGIAELLGCHTNWADVNVPDHNGLRPLHHAVINGKISVVKSLLGSEINARDKYGKTPLCYATMNGQENIVKLLIHNGAKVDEIDSGKNTVLYDATINTSKFLTTVINTDNKKMYIEQKNHNYISANYQNKLTGGDGQNDMDME